MWFKSLSWILCAVCLSKGLIGLLFHSKFYAWDKKQYASKGWPLSFAIFIPYGIILFSLTWYATIIHYVEYGWILTLVATVAGIKIAGILLSWKRTSTKFVEFIEKNEIALWVLDGFLLTVGVLFALLAIYVY